MIPFLRLPLILLVLVLGMPASLGMISLKPLNEK